MKQISKGSCLCKKVSFEIKGDFESFFLCHCKFCQKDTGSAHAANLFSSSAEIQWLSGKTHVKTHNPPSTEHAKSFCTECGSALPTMQINNNFLVTPAGSLDTEVTLKPNAHIFMSNEATWAKGLASVPKLDKLP